MSEPAGIEKIIRDDDQRHTVVADGETEPNPDVRLVCELAATAFQATTSIDQINKEARELDRSKSPFEQSVEDARSGIGDITRKYAQSDSDSSAAWHRVFHEVNLSSRAHPPTIEKLQARHAVIEEKLTTIRGLVEAGGVWVDLSENAQNGIAGYHGAQRVKWEPYINRVGTHNDALVLPINLCVQSITDPKEVTEAFRDVADSDYLGYRTRQAVFGDAACVQLLRELIGVKNWHASNNEQFSQIRKTTVEILMQRMLAEKMTIPGATEAIKRTIEAHPEDDFMVEINLSDAFSLLPEAD